MYNFISDSGPAQQSFLSMSEILKYVSQEEIFSLVFKELPQLGELYCSPFRPDNYPSCWFSFDENNKLFFVDFGCSAIVNNIKLSHIDCFSAVFLHFKFTNFKSSLLFIKNILIDKKNLELKKEIKIFQKKEKNTFNISVFKRPFNNLDKNFWSSYSITSNNLQEDEVFSIVASTSLYDSGKISSVYYKQLAYAYCEFENEKKKIYQPLSKNFKFYTNCTNNDIGGFKVLAPYGKKLVITKGYKDYRVLKNLGLNVIWVQSESMFPNEEFLTNLMKRFSEFIIWFDNDAQGIRGSDSLKQIMDNIKPGKTKQIWTSFHKDPSDFCKNDRKEFLTFTNNYVL